MSESIFTRKRKTRAWIAVPFLLLPLYLFFFPRPMGRELVLRPVWSLDLRRTAVAGEHGDETQGVFPFRAGKWFGYAHPDGRLLYKGVSRYRVALSVKGFINFGSRPDHVVFMDPGGGFQFSVQSFGYPLLDSTGEVLYSVNSDLSGLKRLSVDGEILWQGEFSSPMTSLALRGENCLIGLLDGRAALYGPAGETLYEIDPPGSRVPVILGTALADSGALALVSGIDPQNLILVQGERYETVRSTALASDFRREVVLSFGPGERFLYVEQEGELLVLEPGRERFARLPLPGRLRSFAAGREFAAAAAEAPGAEAAAAQLPPARLVVFRPPASPLAVAALSEVPGWSRISDGSLFVGLDNELVRADVVEE
jgi:hypothetical protein